MNIPISDDGRLLVDIEAPASEGLLRDIAAMGGNLLSSPDPTRIVAAIVPFSALEALAGRADIRTISIAKRRATSGMKLWSEISANGNADR